MTIATLETSFDQGQIILTDGAGKGSRSSKALEFGFEVCIHSFSLAKKGLDGKCLQSAFLVCKNEVFFLPTADNSEFIF